MNARKCVAISALALVGLFSGCATTTSTVDVQSAQAPAAQAPAVAAKGFAKIMEVRDLRRFEAAPKDPSTPSLENAQELKNAAITSRAIARKRGGYGMAFANVLLPEGRTVELVVREAVVKALTEQGYEVVDAKSPQFDKALPVKVDIDQFWAWFTPGFWQVSVEFRCLLMLKAEALTGRNEDIVQGSAVVKGMAATDAEWKEAVVAGVSDLTKNLRTVIKPAS
jgi:uncharacterized lipoprotein YajG